MESCTRRRPDGATPEAGLTEWTNRIRALQRDVDEDEAAEQRKLEEEIRASRLARSRRSGGAQLAGMLPAHAVQEGDSPTDRVSGRNDALKRLMGEPTPSAASPPPDSVLERKASSSVEPMSLAAFMGGKATGPRLNRAAPQMDAHDPTQFEQRSLSDITTPHPIFGTGGIALPGLASKGKPIVKDNHNECTFEPIGTSVMAPKTVIASATPTTPVTPLKSSIRERTLSTPSSAVPSKIAGKQTPLISSGSPGVRNRVESLYAHATRSSDRGASPPILKSSRSSDKIAQRPPVPVKPKPESLRKSTSAAVHVTETTSATSPSRHHDTTSSPLSTSPPIVIPSLARPVQPSHRPQSLGPRISLGKSPAPAFLKPQQQKDLTPSLSRLQGRGFVQSFVKLSGEIEAAAGNSPDRALSPPKNNVLDRWNSPRTPSPSPIASPISAPQLRKAKTIDSPASPLQDLSISTKTRPPPPPKVTRSQSHSAGPVQPPPASKALVPDPGNALPLGSSNTLISYIKINKTGEQQTDERPRQPKTPSQHVDERGMRSKSRSRSRPRAHSSPRSTLSPTRPGKSEEKVTQSGLLSMPSSGQPLNHLTKDRARVKRKGVRLMEKSTVAEVQQSLPADVPKAAFSTTVQSKDLMQEQGHTRARIHVPVPSERGEALPKSPGPVRGENIKKLQSAWSNHGPIGVQTSRKPPSLSYGAPNSPTNTVSDEPRPIRQSLPGLATVQMVTSPASPSPPNTPPLATRQERKLSPSPGRHGRIPSTGNRPTVMDVAQTFQDHPPDLDPISPSPSFIRASPFPAPYLPPFVSRNAEGDVRTETDPGGWGEDERTITPAVLKAERRRSTLEKYSSFTLPIVAEEKTPVSTPISTLKKVDPAAVQAANNDLPVTEKGVELEESIVSTKIYVDSADEPIPSVSASRLWDIKPSRFRPDPGLHTVSVEVKILEGTLATEIVKGPSNVFAFYDSEIVAIVHRAKSRSSGLVTTKVWEWTGRNAESEGGRDKEREKSAELARRFGTELVKVEQFAEKQELVHILGGILITRSGKRDLWSTENTTMYVVRSVAELIFIDEVDLSISNLCSGFSFCISVLDNLWVWYGCGSSHAERSAALQYAQSLVDTTGEPGAGGVASKTVVEVEEGKEDVMFWMFLGEESYAKSSYWKWRKIDCGGFSDPRTFIANCANLGSEVVELETFPRTPIVARSVLIVHLVYEIFVLVGESARTERRNIKLGLSLAQEFSSYTAKTKPFEPPVHVLIFPSQIPLDMKSALRGLDRNATHGSEAPLHMNLLTAEAAWSQLFRKEFEKVDLSDASMLPLGIGP